MPSGTRTPGPIDRALAAELRALIARQGKLDKDVAAEAGIAGATFSNLVRALRPIDVSQLHAVSVVLNVEPADVMRSATEALRSHPEVFAAPALVTAEAPPVPEPPMPASRPRAHGTSRRDRD